MIQTHEFNTAWWGGPTGVVTGAKFFELPEPERTKLLAPFQWVEYKLAADGDLAAAGRISAAGFVQVDTQIRFRIRLEPVTDPSTSSTVQFADEQPFLIRPGECRPFRHERFFQLPGATAERVAERYALWANRLIEDHPEWCLELLAEGQTQGWFCARPTGKNLELTLAMLHRDAQVSGFTLYHEALAAFAKRGARLGTASFSVDNTDVLNLYARLGAHFLPPMSCWLWVAPGKGAPG